MGVSDLLSQAGGATLGELNKATGWSAWSYINDTKRLAERAGKTPHWEGAGKTPHWEGAGEKRRFWID